MPTVDAIPDDLRAQLAPDERVEVVIRGVHGQRMYGTDRRVFVYKKGWLAGALLGRKIASWDYRNITGVHLDRGAMYGVVAIHAAGISTTPVRYQSTNKAEDAFSVRHAIPVARIWDELDEAVSLLRGLIADAQRGAESTQEHAVDPIALLRRLGDLHDAGVVTDAQFEAKRAELLARL
jgi:Short C-terminal domain